MKEMRHFFILSFVAFVFFRGKPKLFSDGCCSISLSFCYLKLALFEPSRFLFSAEAGFAAPALHVNMSGNRGAL